MASLSKSPARYCPAPGRHDFTYRVAECFVPGTASRTFERVCTCCRRPSRATSPDEKAQVRLSHFSEALQRLPLWARAARPRNWRGRARDERCTYVRAWHADLRALP